HRRRIPCCGVSHTGQQASCVLSEGSDKYLDCLRGSPQSRTRSGAPIRESPKFSYTSSPHRSPLFPWIPHGFIPLMRAPRYDLGVLFVHGIGSQPRGSTLTEFGTPLIDWVSRRARASGATATVRTASLVRDDEEPPRAELEIHTETRSTRWLLAESWWAQSFPGARFSDVARWGFVIVPWAIGSHFAKRLSRVEGRKHGGFRWILSFASALATLLGGLLLSPFLLLVLAITLLLGKIPIPQLQSALSQLQSPIASSLGDSYMLVTRPIEAAAIQAKIVADLEWLTPRCEKVAVLAHSQGAALAARVVSSTPGYKGLLITFGSGLRKLEELDAIREEPWISRGAWFTVGSIVFAA